MTSAWPTLALTRFPDDGGAKFCPYGNFSKVDLWTCQKFANHCQNIPVGNVFCATRQSVEKVLRAISRRVIRFASEENVTFSLRSEVLDASLMILPAIFRGSVFAVPRVLKLFARICPVGPIYVLWAVYRWSWYNAASTVYIFCEWVCFNSWWKPTTSVMIFATHSAAVLCSTY